MRTLLLAMLVCLSACGQTTPQQQEASATPRPCTAFGGMSIRVCQYRPTELLEHGRGPTFGVMVYGYLRRSDSRLALAEERDGQAVVFIGELLDKHMRPEDAEAMVGQKVRVVGIYHPAGKVIDAQSLGWVKEPDVPSPTWPPRDK
ncbi:hypothetical protein [Luteimonas sp. R10]|uniref:hypothetical protein n=1 Tax=Luteimonas sp. R10 TaxID=3108176 RepID=UPI00308E7B1B|nr:hypothetical protein U3649_14880 [Luteimonas sp. R10]